MEVEKYNHIIVFEDKTTKPELVDKYKDKIVGRVQRIIDETFDFDISLILRVVEIDTSKANYVNHEIMSGYTTMDKKGRFIICFGIESLERFEHDGGLDIAISITHELGHVYDMYNILNNNYYSYNPLLAKQKKFEDFIIQIGWDFWTEFFAYYFTFKEFKELHNYPSFHQIVVGYQKLVEEYEIIKPNVADKKNQNVKELAHKHIDNIEQFLYATAKYLAGCLAGKQKYYKVKPNKKNYKYIEELDKILVRFMRLISPMFNNTHGKGMTRKLWNLSRYIIMTFYLKYNIRPYKHKGHYTFAYFTD